MSRSRGAQADSLQRIRAELATRLRARSAEIEEAILTRVRALSDPMGAEDPEYVNGLRVAVADVVGYGFSSIEHGPEWAEPIPPTARTQARQAARFGVRLDTVLRRYAAGDRLLGDFVMEAADQFPSQALREVLRTQGSQVDLLMAAVAAEYMEELKQMRRSPSQRLAERVQRLLVGDGPIDFADMSYEFGGWHLGVIARGAGSEAGVKALAGQLRCQALIVPRGNDVVWAWLGGTRQPAPSDVERFMSTASPHDISLAVGEPRRGMEGWRLTHQEAQAAFEVMLRRPRRITRSSEVVLLAAVLRDEALARSLTETYLAPLEGDAGAVLRETLRAYFAAGSNAATAAAALGVDRHTVQRRVRKVEKALGRLLTDCQAELEVTLSLDEIDDGAGSARPPMAG